MRGRWTTLAHTMAPAAVAAACLVGAGPASAATFTVDSTVDAPLAEPSGTACVSTHNGECTLRAAVQAADNAMGSSTIKLPAGEYRLEVARGGGADEPQNGDLDVGVNALVIVGAGASQTIIDANKRDRAFHIHSGASLEVARVNVKDGEAKEGENGGAFLNEGVLSVKQSVLEENAAEMGGAIASTATATSTAIVGSTADGNLSEAGGVVFATGGGVTLVGDTITHNQTGYGGGGVLYDEEADPAPVTVSRSTISHNVSEGPEGGGALFLKAAGSGETGPLTVFDSTLDEDKSDIGGAIYDYKNGTVEIRNSTFNRDEAVSEPAPGGAIYADEVKSLTVANSVFEEDRASGGGAVFALATPFSVRESTFSEDTASRGGALYFDNLAVGGSTVETSTFVGGDASEFGGAIFGEDGAIAISRTTVSLNTAYADGGGLFFAYGAFSLVNDTLYHNEAADYASGLGLDAEPMVERTLKNVTIADGNAGIGGALNDAGTLTSIENTVIVSNGGGDCVEAAGPADTGGNVDSDGSCFSELVSSDHVKATSPGVATLANNGGLTGTDLLEVGSPAIGAAVEETCPDTDERGVVRTEPCDSGAYEVGEYVALTVPAATTGSAEMTGEEIVTLAGEVNPNGVQVTACEIEFGTSRIYEFAVPCSPTLGAGTSGVAVRASAGELIPDTTYHYRIAATNSNGTSYGEDETFETTFTPPVTTTTTTSTASAASTTTTTTTSKSTSLPARQCRSGRIERLTWKVHRGAHLRRILVTVDDRPYRTLRPDTRRTSVSFVGRGKGPVTVRVIAVSRSARRHTITFTFHPCVSRAGGHGVSRVPTL